MVPAIAEVDHGDGRVDRRIRCAVEGLHLPDGAAEIPVSVVQNAAINVLAVAQSIDTAQVIKSVTVQVDQLDEAPAGSVARGGAGRSAPQRLIIASQRWVLAR